MRGNLKLLVILGGLSGARFGMGIWVLYFLLFTDYAGIGLTETLILGGGLLFEIPSGAFADLAGRRRALIAAYAVQTAGFVMLAAAGSFWMICVAVLTFTLGQALASGAFEALIYDSLAQLNDEQGYRRYLARAQSAKQVMFAVSGAAGGFLFAWEAWLPYVATAIASVAACAVSFFLEEPPTEQVPWNTKRWLRQTNQGLRHVATLTFGDPLIRMMMLGAMLAAVMHEVLDDVLAVAYGLRDWQLGLFFAGVFLLSAYASKRSADFPKSWRPERVLPVLALVMAGTLALSPWLGIWFGCLAIALRFALFAIWGNIQSEVLNAHATSRDRATFLSSFMMVRNLPYAIAAYGIGASMDALDPRWFAVVLGLLWLVVTLLTLPRNSTRVADGR